MNAKARAVNSGFVEEYRWVEPVKVTKTVMFNLLVKLKAPGHLQLLAKD